MTARIDPTRLAHLGAILADDVVRGAIPGAAVIVAHRGEIVYDEAFGLRDRATGAPLARDAIFRAASMTKPVAVVAALAYVERGKLDLFAPVSTYLPAFAKLRVGASREPLVREPTIQDLMRHTAGFTYGDRGQSEVHRLYREANVTDPHQTNADLVRKLAEIPLVFQPGTVWEYGMSTDVLGAVIETVAGAPLRDVIREVVTGPLGMTDSDFALCAHGLARLAEPHADPVTGKNTLDFLFTSRRPEPAWHSAGAGLLTTAADYYRFAAMLANGGTFSGTRILGRATVALMTSDHLPPHVGYGPATDRLGITAPLPELGQGFGLGVAVRLETGRNPSPGSPGDFSWPGISGTFWWADPCERLVAVLMLAAPELRVHYRSLVRNLVYAALV